MKNTMELQRTLAEIMEKVAVGMAAVSDLRTALMLVEGMWWTDDTDLARSKKRERRKREHEQAGSEMEGEAQAAMHRLAKSTHHKTRDPHLHLARSV
ncbi:hypothetical protein GQ600_16590 [Phytophthora cactorum]|nr:hypothetical protein GQ600_16590 [Phytophthora cactorum]